MVRTYKPKIGKFILNLIGGFLLGGFVFIVRWEPIITDQTAPWMALGIIVLNLLLAIGSLRVKLELTDQVLTVYQGGKVRHYELDTHGFGARTHNDSRKYLIIHQPDGRKEEVDCEFLSDKDFNRLTDDLAITGPKQQAVKVTVKEKSIIEE